MSIVVVGRDSYLVGFTSSIYRQVLLNRKSSIIVDRNSFLTVQPNLRAVKCQQNSHCAPLEREAWLHRCSIDIALLWSEKLNQSAIPPNQWIFK